MIVLSKVVFPASWYIIHHETSLSNDSIVRALPATLIPIWLIERGKDLVVGTSNDALFRLSLLNLRSQPKLFFYSLLFNVINCSNFVNACSISNVCNNICLQCNSYIIQNEKINYKSKLIYQTINTPTANIVTIVNKPSSLREDDDLPLHDGCSTPDKFDSPYSPFFSAVKIISVQPKIWRPKPKNNYKPMVCTDVDEDLYTFKSCGKIIKRAESWTSRPCSDVIPWNSSLC